MIDDISAKRRRLAKKAIAIAANSENYDDQGRLKYEAQLKRNDYFKRIEQLAQPRVWKVRSYKDINVDDLLTVSECESAIDEIRGDDDNWQSINDGFCKYVLIKEAAAKVEEINKKIYDLKNPLTRRYIEESKALYQDENHIKEDDHQITHGGKRKNAGRKKKEPTIMVRCPESIKEDVLKIIKRYKETGKIEIE